MATEIITLIVGFALGLGAAFVLLRARFAAQSEILKAKEAELLSKTQALDTHECELRAALDAKARAEQAASRVPTLEQQIASLDEVKTRLFSEIAAFQKQQEADKDKIQWLANAENQLREAFKALAADSLKDNSAQFAHLAESKIQGQVDPVKEALQKLDQQIQAIEEKRTGAYEGIKTEIGFLKTAHDALKTAAVNLEHALKSPTARGSWGEVQLRRIVEISGMLSHVDFDVQTSGGSGSGRPDMIVRLPMQGILPVDAKTNMNSYLKATEVSDDQEKARFLDAFVAEIKGTIQRLANKQYWSQFPRAPEIVVMFVPYEAGLSAAYERDPGLLEYAFSNKVLPTAPVTLLALLKTIAYGWQQHQVADNARAIAEQGKVLYERLLIFLQHLTETGNGLKSAVKAYNNAIGSLESRLIPAAKRFKELSAASEPLPITRLIETETRTIALPNEESGSNQDAALPGEIPPRPEPP